MHFLSHLLGRVRTDDCLRSAGSPANLGRPDSLARAAGLGRTRPVDAVVPAERKETGGSGFVERPSADLRGAADDLAL